MFEACWNSLFSMASSQLREALSRRIEKTKAKDEATSSPADLPDFESTILADSHDLPPPLVTPEMPFSDTQLLKKESVLDNVSICEGYLNKLSSGEVTGRWQRRFFVLTRTRLSYFSRRPGVGDTQQARRVLKLAHLEGVTASGKCGIKIHSAREVFEIEANSEADCMRWFSALEDAIAEEVMAFYSNAGGVDVEFSETESMSSLDFPDSKFLKSGKTAKSTETPQTSVARSKTPPPRVTTPQLSPAPRTPPTPPTPPTPHTPATPPTPLPHLDNFFSERFPTQPALKTAQILDACVKVLENFWEEARSAPQDKKRLSDMAEAYISRLDKTVSDWLQNREGDVALFPAIVEFLVRAEIDLEIATGGGNWKRYSKRLVSEFLGELKVGLLEGRDEGGEVDCLEQAFKKGEEWGKKYPSSGGLLMDSVAGAILASLNSSRRALRLNVDEDEEKAKKGLIQSKFAALKKAASKKIVGKTNSPSIDDWRKAGNTALGISRFCREKAKEINKKGGHLFPIYLVEGLRENSEIFREIARGVGEGLVKVFFTKNMRKDYEILFSPPALKAISAESGVMPALFSAITKIIGNIKDSSLVSFMYSPAVKAVGAAYLSSLQVNRKTLKKDVSLIKRIQSDASVLRQYAAEWGVGEVGNFWFQAIEEFSIFISKAKSSDLSDKEFYKMLINLAGEVKGREVFKAALKIAGVRKNDRKVRLRTINDEQQNSQDSDSED